MNAAERVLRALAEAHRAQAAVLESHALALVEEGHEEAVRALPDPTPLAVVQRLLGRSRSALLGDIHRGRFGPPGQAGGPQKEGRGWALPRRRVLEAMSNEAPGPSVHELAPLLVQPGANAGGLGALAHSLAARRH